jgi:hypothetical protein
MGTINYTEVIKKPLDVLPANRLPEFSSEQDRLEKINKDADKKPVLNSIDRPILPLVLELNRIGLQTTFSCCGYSYRGEEEPKSHSKWTNVLFYITNNDAFIALKEILKKIRYWDIILNTTSGNNEQCLILQTPAPIWNNCDNLTEAIHNYEVKLINIKNLTELLKNIPTAVKQSIIRDGNEGRANYYKDEWPIVPKQPVTIVWEKEPENDQA